MRTTVDIPEDLLELAKSIARGRGITLSRAVVDMMRDGITQHRPPKITRSAETGLPIITLGGPTITDEDVRALEDEEDEYLASFITGGGSGR